MTAAMAMIRILLLQVFVVMIDSGLCAQSLQLSANPIDDNGFEHVKLIGQDENGFYLLMSNLSVENNRSRQGLRARKYEISYFDMDLQPKWRKKADGFPVKGNIESIGVFQGKVVILSSEVSKENYFTLFLSVVDRDASAIISSRVVGRWEYTKNQDYRSPELLISPDRTLLGVCTAIYDAGQADLQLHVLDENMNTQLQKNHSAVFDAQEVSAVQFLLSDSSSLVMLSRTMEEIPGQKLKTELFTLHLFGSENAQKRTFALNQPQQPMSEAAIAIHSPSNTVVATGFISDKTAFTGASLLLAKLPLSNPDGFIRSIGKFQKDTQINLIGQRNKGPGSDLASYPILQIVPRSDGGVLLITEAAYTSEYNFYDYFTQTFNRRIEYHYDNVVVLSINADASIHWSQVVQKEQRSMDDEGVFSSIKAMIGEQSLSILYNMQKGKGNEMVFHEIDAAGHMGNRQMIRQSDNISLLTRFGKQVAQNTLVFPAYTKKRLYLLKAVF